MHVSDKSNVTVSMFRLMTQQRKEELVFFDPEYVHFGHQREQHLMLFYME